MIPEPYKSRLIEAGNAKDHAEIDLITTELRMERPDLFRPVRCAECAKQRAEGEALWCIPQSQFRSPEIERQCGEFEQRKS